MGGLTGRLPFNKPLSDDELAQLDRRLLARAARAPGTQTVDAEEPGW